MVHATLSYVFQMFSTYTVTAASKAKHANTVRHDPLNLTWAPSAARSRSTLSSPCEEEEDYVSSPSVEEEDEFPRTGTSTASQPQLYMERWRAGEFFVFLLIHLAKRGVLMQAPPWTTRRRSRP